jgi:hypothetical protein
MQVCPHSLSSERPRVFPSRVSPHSAAFISELLCCLPTGLPDRFRKWEVARQKKWSDMIRRKKAAVLRRLAANETTVYSEPPPLPPLAEKSVIEEHRTLMAGGQLICCLRDVHRYWSTPNISYDEIEVLEQQNLIQRSTTGICAIRLTEQGVAVKNWQLLKTP